MKYVSYNELAKEKERKAISMVEQEIESWTTSKKN
jgi:putative type I restriction-modification system, S subunit